jgi:hypothetical protein
MTSDVTKILSYRRERDYRLLFDKFMEAWVYGSDLGRGKEATFPGDNEPWIHTRIRCQKAKSMSDLPVS